MMFELSGPAATIALHLPLALLLAVVLWTTRGSVRTQRTAPVEGRPLGRYGAPLAVPRTPAPPGSIEDLALRLAKAEAKGDGREQAGLHLALALEQVSAGQTAAAADNLRAAIRIAARLGSKETQARARLALGDLARADGDLTTACEHWQIARGLFLELKRPSDLAEAETRMRTHGCPTDWVLNDF